MFSAFLEKTRTSSLGFRASLAMFRGDCRVFRGNHREADAFSPIGTLLAQKAG
jgi:hypothetical protein